MLGVPLAWADAQPGALKNVEEEDGSPSCFGWQLKVTNASLTDNGDGSCSVTTGAASGDITDVGNCATGACLTGTSGSRLTLDGTRDIEFTTDGSRFFIADTTNNVQLLAIDAANRVGLPSLGLCDTVGTDATGFFKCAAGGGSGTVTGLSADTGGTTTGSTITLAGTTSGIDTSRSGDTVTVALDLTELSSATLGAGSFTALTVDAGATDPVFTFGSGTTDLSSSDFTVSAATPAISFNATSGRDAEWVLSGSVIGLADTTNNVQLLQFPPGNVVRWPTYAASCGVLRIGPNNQMTCDSNIWTKTISASSLEPLEAAESIPPLTKTTGTNLDTFSISFDATTDEGRKFLFAIPSNAIAGTLVFRIRFWSATSTSGKAVWDIRTPPSAGNGAVSWDDQMTTVSATCMVAGTVKFISTCTITTTMAALGWSPGQTAGVLVYRDANHTDDTMTGDAQFEAVNIEGPAQ